MVLIITDEKEGKGNREKKGEGCDPNHMMVWTVIEEAHQGNSLFFRSICSCIFLCFFQLKRSAQNMFLLFVGETRASVTSMPHLT